MMGNLPKMSVNIQASSASVPSTPSWFGEITLIVTYLRQQGILAKISEQMRFAFAVSDLQHEYERLKQLGVVWAREPAQVGPVTIALFDDTCGNLIQLVQV